MNTVHVQSNNVYKLSNHKKCVFTYKQSDTESDLSAEWQYIFCLVATNDEHTD